MTSDTVRQPKNFGGSAKKAAHDADRARQGEGEDAFAAILDDMGLAYERQFLYAEGRKLRADFVVSLKRGKPLDPLEYPSIIIQVEGGIFTRQAHGSIKGVLADIDRALADIDRANEAAINSWFYLRVTPEMVRDGRARELLERLLA